MKDESKTQALVLQNRNESLLLELIIQRLSAYKPLTQEMREEEYKRDAERGHAATDIEKARSAGYDTGWWDCMQQLVEVVQEYNDNNEYRYAQ